MLHRYADRQISGEYIDFLSILYHQMVRKGSFMRIFGDARIPEGFRATAAAPGMNAISTRMRLILLPCNLAFIIPR
jgi:hypothetical protein